MKLNKIITLSVLCLGLLSSFVQAEKKEVLTVLPAPIDKIEAVVNQEVILSSDIVRMHQNISERYAQEGKALPEGTILKQQILDKLITDSLQLQIADRMGLRIKDAQVNQTLQEIASKQGTTIKQMKSEMLLKGESYNAFADNVRNEITINEVRQIQVRRRINISDQEVEQMIKRLHDQGNKLTKFNFVHILLKQGDDTSAEGVKKQEEDANAIIKKIKAGEDINALAAKYSQGPKAAEGGDWGWRTINEIPSLFASAFDDIKTKKGDIIGPFKSSMGLHIIKIVDKQGSESVMTLEVNARHILIKTSIILSDEKAIKMLNEFRDEILSGKKTFAELAEANSQDPGSAVKGGELGFADPTMYVPEFRDQAINMKVGEITPPFKTMHGWHILEVIAKRQSDTTDDATKQKAYSILFRQRFPAEVYAWLNEIREEAYIKINNPEYVIEKK